METKTFFNTHMQREMGKQNRIMKLKGNHSALLHAGIQIQAPLTTWVSRLS